MKNVLHWKKWIVLVIEQHVDQPPISMIKSKHDDKSDKDFVKIKLSRDMSSEKSDLC